MADMKSDSAADSQSIGRRGESVCDAWSTVGLSAASLLLVPSDAAVDTRSAGLNFAQSDIDSIDAGLVPEEDALTSESDSVAAVDKCFVDAHSAIAALLPACDAPNPE